MKINIITLIPIKNLPPAISLISCLHDLGYEVVVTLPYLDDEYRDYLDNANIKYNQFTTKENWLKLTTKKIKLNKILIFDFNNFIFSKLTKIDKKKDLVWVLHEDTTARLSKKIYDYNYIVTVYELRRNIKIMKYFPSNYINILKRANLIVTPEYNRSHILKAWYQLSKTPKVLPNKPYYLSNKLKSNEVENRMTILNQKIKDRHIILYQGVFGKDRYIEPFIEATLKIHNSVIVLMGQRNDYLDMLLKKYGDSIIYIQSLAPPQHLEITKRAYIGIVSYQNNNSIYDPLNVVYCAPNKIYEYSKYSIPMICSGQPGLHYTVELNHAGICVDSLEPEIIKKSIQAIIKNYDEYKEGAKKLYNAIKVDEIIQKIVNEACKKE